MLILLETMTEERCTATAPGLPEPPMTRPIGGDQEALAELYRHTRTSVYGLAPSYLKNQHGTKGATQDAFVRAWENTHQYRPRGTLLAWLLTITRDLALMKLRERGRTQGMALEDREWLAAENLMVIVEDRQVLGATLVALADGERQIVLLRVVTGRERREITDLLELPLPTVLSEYRRTLLRLKAGLEGGDAL